MSDQAYVLGGAGYSSRSNACRLYDLSDNAWTSKTNMLYSRDGGRGHYFGAGAYVNGYVFGDTGGEPGDKKCEEYNISGNSWTAKTDQPTNDGNRGAPYNIGYLWASSLRYYIAGNSWSVNGRGSPSGFSVGEYVYGIGGWGSTGVKINVADLSVGSIVGIPASRGNQGASYDGTYGYSFGGGMNGNDGSWSADNYRYNPSDNTWATRAGLGASTQFNGTFVIEGKCHSVGGHMTTDSTNYHGRYDNGANSWISKAVFPASGGCVGFNVLSNFPPNAPSGLSVSTT